MLAERRRELVPTVAVFIAALASMATSPIDEGWLKWSFIPEDAFTLSPEQPRAVWRLSIDGNNEQFQSGALVPDEMTVEIGIDSGLLEGPRVPIRCALRHDGGLRDLERDEWDRGTCKLFGHWRNKPCDTTADCRATLIITTELQKEAVVDGVVTGTVAMGRHDGSDTVEIDLLRLTVELERIE